MRPDRITRKRLGNGDTRNQETERARNHQQIAEEQETDREREETKRRSEEDRGCQQQH